MCVGLTGWQLQYSCFFAAGLRVIGISFGQPNPLFFPSYAPYGMVHEHLPIHPDEFLSVSIPVNMTLKNQLNPGFFEYPSLIVNTNYILLRLTGALDGRSWRSETGGLCESMPTSPFTFFHECILYSAVCCKLLARSLYHESRPDDMRRFALACWLPSPTRLYSMRTILNPARSPQAG